MCNDTCIDGNPLGGLDKFWETDPPKVPPCLEHTVLIWAPCAIFWLTLPFEVIKLLNGNDKKDADGDGLAKNGRKRLVLLAVRLISLSLVFLCSITRVALIYHIDIPWPSIISAFALYPITMLSLMVITILLYRQLIAPPSAYTWMTLCGFVIFGIPELVSSIQNAKHPDVSPFSTGTYLAQYIFLIISLITFSISDPILSNETDWPEEYQSFPSKLMFWWFTKILLKGYRNVLTISDMFTVSRHEQTSSVFGEFEKNLHKTFGVPRNKAPGDWDMIMVIGRTFYKPVLAAAILQLTNVLLIFVAPVVISWMMVFVRHTEEPTWHGYIYLVIIFAATVLRSFSCQYHLHYMNKFGVRARAAIVAAVYRKALNMSTMSNTGEIVNLMAVDSARFMDVAPWLNLLWAAPFQVLFGLFYIYGIVGHAVWAGMAVMAFIFTCTSIVSKQMHKLQMKQLHEKDRRIKLLTEMLNGMKVVKLYAWEPAFARFLQQIRVKELKFIRIIAYLFGFIDVSFCCTNLLACMGIFGVYCLLDSSHNVTAEKAFIVLTIFNIIRVPFIQLPLAASYTMMTLASVTRLRNYFCQSDLVSYIESRKSGIPIEIEKASFSWETNSKDPILRDINLSVKSGQVVAVVGSVGSGKSSLINALCGEMQKQSGSVFVNGSVAYVAQQAWIQNMTVRDNILFGQPYNERRYQKIIHACSLKQDLELLPNGDLTIIGERGSNLSGGQKQRISMARSVYQNADIYLFDDPLSAVDIQVGKSIFDAVIGPNGLLRKKARLLVTHGVQYLPFCDSIILMERGKFLAVGTFEELAKDFEVYADFMEQNVMPDKKDVPTHRLSSVNDDIDFHRKTSKQISGASQDARLSKMVLERLTSTTSVISDRQNMEEDDDDGVEEEEMQVGKISWRTYWIYAKDGGLAVLMLTIFIVLSELSYTAGTLWLEKWTDSVPTPAQLANSSLNNSHVISSHDGLGMLGACTALQFITTFIYSLYFVRFSICASTKIHKRLLESVLRAPMSFFDTTPSGRLINRFGKDMNAIDNQIPGSMSAVIRCLVTLVAFFIPVIYASPIFVSMLIPLMIFYVIFQKFYVASSRQFRRLEAVTRSPIYSHFQESIHGIATIRASRQQDRFCGESDRLVDINNSAHLTLLASNRWLCVHLDLIGNLVVAGAVLSAILMRATMLPGLVGLSISYALSITGILNWGIQKLSLFETEVVALERVNEYTDTPAEAESETRRSSIPKNWPANGAVEFDSYSSSYRPGLPLVLKDFQCRINAGEKVGVVGRTGAGKSSLTLALFRLIDPVEGTVLVDGVDINHLGLHELRRQLAIIPQEPVLFSGTLRDNIDPFEQYTDADLFKALELSHLKSFVRQLSGGLSHEINESGANLSVGQRQLLCLARALLKKSKILILDEATASVDVETDALIQRTVREQFAQSTVITIAHRLNTILDYDRFNNVLERDLPESRTNDIDWCKCNGKDGRCSRRSRPRSCYCCQESKTSQSMAARKLAKKMEALSCITDHAEFYDLAMNRTTVAAYARLLADTGRNLLVKDEYNHKVMVLDSGRLVEYGSPAELIDNEGSQFDRMRQEAGIKVSSSDLKSLSSDK